MGYLIHPLPVKAFPHTSSKFHYNPHHNLASDLKLNPQHFVSQVFKELFILKLIF